jgi:hypothetical protein
MWMKTAKEVARHHHHPRKHKNVVVSSSLFIKSGGFGLHFIVLIQEDLRGRESTREVVSTVAQAFRRTRSPGPNNIILQTTFVSQRFLEGQIVAMILH